MIDSISITSAKIHIYCNVLSFNTWNPMLNAIFEFEFQDLDRMLKVDSTNLEHKFENKI